MPDKLIPKDSIHRIMILGSIGIGNLLLFSSCLRVLRESFPQAYITMIVLKKGFVELYENDQNVDEVIISDYAVHDTWWKRFQLIWDLRNKKFDLSITTFPANRVEYNLLPFLAGAKYRIAHRYRTKFWRTLSFLQNVKVPVDLTLHDLEQNIALLFPLGIEGRAEKRLFITLSDKHHAEAAQFLEQSCLNRNTLFIGIHAGSSSDRNMDLKRWETEKFITLCRRIRERFPVSFLLFGGPEEKPIKDEIARELGDDGCVPVEQVSLKTTAALIGNCRLFITNDSGLMHVAVATDVPCVAIFGPTDSGRTAPYGPRHRVVRLGLHCSPCWSIRNVGVGRIKCIYPTNQCLKELLVERVYKVVEEMLQL